jgi:hypothetical protein
VHRFKTNLAEALHPVYHGGLMSRPAAPLLLLPRSTSEIFLFMEWQSDAF